MKYSLAIFFAILALLSACVTFTPPQKRLSHSATDLSHNKSRSSRYRPTSASKNSENSEKSQKAQKGQAQVRQEPVLISNTIKCIAVDDKNVWVASDKGLSRYDKSQNRWSHYTKTDGLSSDDTNAVAIDRNRIWVATSDGVSRFDLDTGNWEVFRKKDGLASDRVWCIAVDGNYVWFGTDGGLNRYDRQISSWAVRTKKDGLVSNKITAIAVENEYVWIGTAKESPQRNGNPSGPGNQDKPSSGGVNRYHRNTDSWNAYSKTDGLVSEEISAIAVDENTVWFGTPNSGVSTYSKTDQTFVKAYTKTDLLASNNIKSIAADGGQVWIATANAGVHRYLKTVNTWMKYTKAEGLASDHVTWIAVHGNEVWFGTYEDGVSKYDKVSNEWIRYIKSEALADDDTRDLDISEVDGKIWVATDSGLSVYDPKLDSWELFGKEDGLISDYITSVEAIPMAPMVETLHATSLQPTSPQINDSKAGMNEISEVWVGTERGVGRFDRGSGKWKFYTKSHGLSSDFITALAYYEGSIWAGTNGGLFKFQRDRDSGSWVKIEVSQNDRVPEAPEDMGMVTSLATNGSGLWIGAQNGLWKAEGGRLLKAEGQRRKAERTVGALLAAPNSKELKAINAIQVGAGEQGEQVWVGMQGGLAYYDKSSNSWKLYTTKDGLPNNNVRALALDQDQDILWVGTPSGLAKYDSKSGEIQTYKETLGLNVRAMKLFQDFLWLATSSGVVKFSKADGSIKPYRAELSYEPFLESSISNIEFDGNYIWFSNWGSSTNGAIIRYNRRNQTWTRFTRFDILKSRELKAMTSLRWIAVDTDAVWFATDLGILRYDKSNDSWLHYTIKDGLASNDVRYVALSSKSVWTTSSNGALISRYDKESGKWSEVKLENDIPMESISHIAVDGDDVWLALRFAGVRRFNEETKAWKSYTISDGMAKNAASWIGVDKEKIWVGHGWSFGTPGGLSSYDKKSGQWQTYSTNDVLSESDVRKIVVAENHVWFIYPPWNQRAGITKYDKRTKEWTTIKPKRDEGEWDWEGGVTEMVEDGDYLWLATDGRGIVRTHMTSGTSITFDVQSGLLNNYTNEQALKVDENFVWVGTHKGLSRYDKKLESWTNFTGENTLIGKEIRAVAADKRYVWCGTTDGLSRYDKVYGTWKNYRRGGSWRGRDSENTLSNDYVSSLAVDEQYLWVGTRGGANRYDKIADRWDRFTSQNGLPSEDITSVAIDGNTIWMGTNFGLCKYPRLSDDPNAWISYTSGVEIKPNIVSLEYAKSLVSNEIWTLAADKKYIWIGTRLGVNQYDKGKDIWLSYTKEDGLASNEISFIAVAEEAGGEGGGEGGSVWFASDNGVTVYDKQQKDWMNYTLEDGLASNRVTCIAIGKEAKEVWFGTFDSGVSCFNRETGKWTTYTKEEGLAHNGIFSIAIDGGQVWIGTHRGLSRYDKLTGIWTTFTERHGDEDL